MKVKQYIIQYLEESGDWVYGGILEDTIRSMLGAKASTVSRECRTLAGKGVLQNQLVQVNGKGPKVVMYRINTEFLNLTQGKERRQEQLFSTGRTY